jgi:hypothetical protein
VCSTGHGLCVGELHGHERLGGRVAVLQVLRQGAAEGVFAPLGNVGQKLSVAFDNETSEAAFEIGFRLPA